MYLFVLYWKTLSQVNEIHITGEGRGGIPVVIIPYQVQYSLAYSCVSPKEIILLKH